MRISKKESQYNINMKALHKIKPDLIELNNMIGMKHLKESIVDQLIYYLQNLHLPIFDNGKSLIKPVKTGIQDNNFIQILSGISKGDEVIVGPYKTVSKLLKNRSLVKVVQEEELNKEKD